MKTFTYNELIQALSGEASAEGEILLPDYCPTVMKVVCTTATPFLRSQTVSGDDAFIGSDTQLIAPVTVGAGATLGAGTTLAKDAPAGKLTISRMRQMTIENWTRPQKTDK